MHTYRTNRLHACAVARGLALLWALCLPLGWDGLTPFASAATTGVSHDPAGHLTAVGTLETTAPSIVAGPVSRTFLPGQAVGLAVGAVGALPLSYQWYFNGAAIPGAQADALLLPNPNGAQAGDYHVLVSNALGFATSPTARLELDSDRDGLGDAWELTYFGSLTNQNATLDRDGDGTPNRWEFLDGSNPTNRQDLLPRLTLWPVGGSIWPDPSQATYRSNDLVTLTAVPDVGRVFLGWFGDVTGTANPATLRMAGNKSVQANFGVPLAEALDSAGPVISGGMGGWLGQTEISHDGRSAVRVAPPFVGTGNAFLEATLTLLRDGTVSFWWRCESDDNSVLFLTVDDNNDFVSQRTLTGATGWLPKTVFVPAGTHRLRWSFEHSIGSTDAENGVPLPPDTAYVDQLTIQDYPNPLLDADANTLPDLWEYRYFDRIGNPPDADPDLDGISTSQELADGTNPNDKSSVKPRVHYVIEGEGQAIASPATELIPYGTFVTNTAVPDVGWDFVAWVGPFDNNFFRLSVVTNNPSSDQLYQAKTFTAIFGRPLGPTLDDPRLAWQTGGNLPWYGQNLVRHDGEDAAQSGLLLTLPSESWLETSVTGPGTLSFWWKVDCAPEWDYLTFEANGEELAGRISGKVDWQSAVVDLPTGAQTLRWIYRREFGYDTNALNSAWLDQVQYTAGPVVPQFLLLPTALEGYPASNVVFRVAARGTPPIQYRVLHNGTPLTAPSNDGWIEVPNVNSTLSGNWIVRATNPVGSTDSPPIPVSILPWPPNDDFANGTVLAGGTVSATGYTFGATYEPDEPSHGSTSAESSIWYRWTAPATGPVQAVVRATNAFYNLSLAVHQGGSLATSVELAGATDYGTDVGDLWVSQATIAWAAEQGTTYHLAVDTGGLGVFVQLDLSPLPPPPNDAFARRIPLTGSYVMVEGDNTLASTEAGEPPLFEIPPFFSLPASHTLWWSWTPPAAGPVTFGLDGNGAPVLSVFTGSRLDSLVLVTNTYLGGMGFTAQSGVTYAISIGAIQAEAGPFSFVLNQGEEPHQAALDLASVAAGEVRLTVRGAPGSEFMLEFSPNLTTWYSWSTNTLNSSGSATLTLPSSGRTKTFYRVALPQP